MDSCEVVVKMYLEEELLAPNEAALLEYSAG